MGDVMSFDQLDKVKADTADILEQIEGLDTLTTKSYNSTFIKPSSLSQYSKSTIDFFKTSIYGGGDYNYIYTGSGRPGFESFDTLNPTTVLSVSGPVSIKSLLVTCSVAPSIQPSVGLIKITLDNEIYGGSIYRSGTPSSAMYSASLRISIDSPIGFKMSNDLNAKGWKGGNPTPSSNGTDTVVYLDKPIVCEDTFKIEIATCLSQSTAQSMGSQVSIGAECVYELLED